MEGDHEKGNESSRENKTWEIVNLPKGKKTVWCKLIYAIIFYLSMTPQFFTIPTRGIWNT